MTEEQAIEILNQALDQGFKKGVYTLQDAAFIVQALTVLFPPKEVETTKNNTMSNSIGNLKNSGLQGNNFPWQLKVLQGLQAIYDATNSPLTCVDQVTVCGTSFNNSSGNSSLNVHITNPIPLEVNINEANDSILIYGFDGTTNRKIKTDAAGSVSINDGGNSITVDGTVSLSAGTLSALENITVQNGPGVNAVNIQDGGNSITVDATALDIRSLTCTDVVSLCFDNAGTPTQVSDTNPLPVNAIVTVPSALDTALFAFDITSGVNEALTTTETSPGTHALDVNLTTRLDCTTDSVSICDGAGNALVINNPGGPADGSINSVLVDLTTGNPAVINPDGTQNNAIYGYDPVSVQNEAITSTASGTSQALDVNIVTPNLAISLGSLVVPAGVTGDLSAFGPNITSITFQNIGTAVANVSVDGGSNFFPVAPGTSINLDPRTPMGYYNGTSFFWDTTTAGASLLIIYNYI